MLERIISKIRARVPLSKLITQRRSTARELQLIAIERLPMVPGRWDDNDEGAISVWGRAIARDGLHGHMRFFINGHEFEDVTYPVREETRVFSEVGGATGFKSSARQKRAGLLADPFWRIDAAPWGVYLPHAWRSAWWLPNPLHERFPIPPGGNIQRVIGDRDAGRFLMGGATVFQNVSQALAELGLAWKDFRRVLDWGCGCGRLSRYLLGQPHLEVHGADIDADNIDWCRDHLHGGMFQVIQPEPKAPYPDEHFDLVVGTSVMTHLTEEMQWAWLEELRRITRPGALLFLSISGALQFAHMGISPILYARIQARGFVDSGRDSALEGFIPDADYYRASWHSHRYVAENWAKYFEVVAIADGIAALQDFVILRRR